VSDEVGVSAAPLQHDHLGVPHDEAAEQSQAQPHVNLKEHLRLEKDVGQSHPEEGGESADQCSSEEEVLSVGGEEGGGGEGGEDDGGEEEGVGDDGRVDPDGHVQQRSHSQSGEEGEAQEHAQPLSPVLAVVGGEVESHGQAEGGQAEEEAATLEQRGEEVDVGTGGRRQHAHRQAGVHILQVGTHLNLKF